MKDLYRQLRVHETASEEQIRAALVAADPPIRAAAEMILLDSRRRPVYDRNRRVLETIGRLRSHLGLNYTRFWARREFKDFWHDVLPMNTPQPQPAKRAVDPMMIARAFRAAGRHGRRHAARWGIWWTAVSLLVILMALATVVWQFLR